MEAGGLAPISVTISPSTQARLLKSALSLIRKRPSVPAKLSAGLKPRRIQSRSTSSGNNSETGARAAAPLHESQECPEDAVELSSLALRVVVRAPDDLRPSLRN